MCGRRKIDREYPEIAMKYGDMEFSLVESLAWQIPYDIVIQFHSNGEPLLYPRFGDAISLFNNIRHIDTNGKLIVEKADEIIGKLDTMTISLFRDDPEQDEQYELVKQFLDIRGNKRPNLIYRCLGEFDLERWKKLPGIIATRVLHSPMGSHSYEKRVTIPEIGICLDLLHHLLINRNGDVSPCVRFDPKKLGVIGNVNVTPLIDIWYGEERKHWIERHIEGKRKDIPLCSTCDFWGVPTGY
jgi:radical SAM protein with 4Fe4S-binding SPASM domain